MRAPEEIPRRRRGRGSGRGRVILLVVAAVLFVLFTSLRGLAGFYTDYLWFDSVDLTQVWSGVLWSKVFLGAFFTLLFFVFCFVNLTIADRLAPKFRATGPEDDLLTRYHEVVDRRAGLVRGIISLLFGLVAGVGVSAQWNEWILFRNGGDFGTKDATFGKDIGFYVFKLPFISAVIDWAFASLVIIPLLGNVAENFVALRYAWAGDGDGAMSVIMHSVVQIALLMTGILVIASQFIGSTPLSLQLDPVLAVSLGLALLVLWMIMSDGEMQPVEAVGLLAVYTILAAAIWAEGSLA